MKSYRLSEVAEQDISEIVSYIAEENAPASSRLLDKLYEAIDDLVLNPQLGHRREDLTLRAVRF